MLCGVLSAVCFFAFDYPALNRALNDVDLQAMIPFSYFIGSIVQIAGCTTIGFALAKARRHRNKGAPVRSFRIWFAVILLLTAAYLLIPEIEWHVSDFVLYAGVGRQENLSLYNSSLIRQLIDLRITAKGSIFAFFSCYVTNYAVQRFKLKEKENLST